MKVTRETTKQVIETVAIVCDRCRKEYSFESDGFEIQEFYPIAFTGGYGSVFEDGTIVEADICQHCLKELIGSFALMRKQ